METGTHLNQDPRSEAESESLRTISRRIRQMPYLDPPENLLPSVMDAIRQKQFPWWYRMIRWAKAPRSLTFSPLQVGALALVLMLVSFVSALHLLRSEQRYALRPAQKGSVPITLTLNRPGARSVSVVGTFNSWQDKGYEMRMDETKGAWTLVLHLPYGHYEYAFVLDGREIIPDPQAEFYEDDGFGNQNAVLIVGNHYDKAI